jgi:hypothetical protein
MKKENSKLIIWAVVALIVGVVIGFLITNATVTGNASGLQKKPYDDIFNPVPKPIITPEVRSIVTENNQKMIEFKKAVFCIEHLYKENNETIDTSKFITCMGYNDLSAQKIEKIDLLLKEIELTKREMYASKEPISKLSIVIEPSDIEDIPPQIFKDKPTVVEIITLCIRCINLILQFMDFV